MANEELIIHHWTRTPEKEAIACEMERRWLVLTEYRVRNYGTPRVEPLVLRPGVTLQMVESEVLATVSWRRQRSLADIGA